MVHPPIPTFLLLTLTFESRLHKLLPHTLHVMWPMHLQSLKLLPVTVKEMYLQENTLFDLRPRSHEMLPSTLYIMWLMHLQYLKLLRSTVKSRRIYKRTQYLTSDHEIKVIGDVAQYPLHHLTYAPAEF